jgi:sirohydrochlorin ferrochelatase
MGLKRGVLVISHGSPDAEWVRLVDEAVSAVRLPDGVPIVSSFLECVEGRLIQDGIDELESRGVDEMYVLPLFVSSGSTHVDDIRQAFGLPPTAHRAGELEPFRVRRARVTVGMPIDDDPIIAELIADNVRELSTAPEREALLLIAHGSRERGLNRIWRDGMRNLAARVRELCGFARAETAMLLPDQAACVMRALTKRRARGASGAVAHSADAAESANAAKVIHASNATNTADATEATKAADAANGVDEAEAAKVADTANGVDEAEAVKAADAANGVDEAEAVKAADVANAPKATDAPEATDAPKAADAANEAEAADVCCAVPAAGPETDAVIVAPLFLSRGYFTNTVIPSRLSGFEYRYNGKALLPNPAISRWMERQIGTWLGDGGQPGKSG